MTSSRRYGWVIVVLGAVAMVGTFPGRTHGIALITESLIADLHVDRLDFAWINTVASLIGASFCLPFGWITDRFGLRFTLTFLMAATGATAWVLVRQSGGFVPLLILVTLQRGFGQSALSAASVTAVGKWHPVRAQMQMGLFAFLVGILFAAAFGVVGKVLETKGWRPAWTGVSAAVALVGAPLMLLFMREAPPAGVVAPGALPPAETGLAQALRTPAFWIFAGSSAIFMLASSGLGLFQEAIFAERGFSAKVYHDILSITFLLGLTAQLASGWFSQRWSLGILNAFSMFFYAGALLMIPFVTSLTTLWIASSLMGLSGGIITVVYFAFWSQAFGQGSLGRIQSAAQLITVVASALGPLIFESLHRHYGSYGPAMLGLAPVVLLFGVASWKVKFPGVAT
ncbi:MAG TPA: MFS transporter [Planctomycetota bacterium]|nr:MFS transporter [Planctomycetota bacterium]